MYYRVYKNDWDIQKLEIDLRPKSVSQVLKNETQNDFQVTLLCNIFFAKQLKRQLHILSSLAW